MGRNDLARHALGDNRPMSSPKPRLTALDALHRSLGATMTDFAGWDMPLRYGSERDEHNAVRTKAGLFDLGVGGVRDHHVLGLFEPVDDQVVEDAAVRTADHGVAGAAHTDGGDVADQGVVQ